MDELLLLRKNCCSRSRLSNSSIPVFTASTLQPYSYQVTATNASGTISQYQLLQSPPGMIINLATGAISGNDPSESKNMEFI
ncbi:MAG: Ig domain-containing protein [Oscillatoriaceae cyanobacterium Prado104]|nr:Ig domain-containing protein [Oscillatoriaceae cyanobacterium Prado104]